MKKRLLKGGSYALAVAAVLAGFGVLQPRALAQVITGTITGTVRDMSGAVVPGAKVALTNQATKVVDNATANHDGSFVFPDLLPGTYRVSVSMTGFATWQESGIALHSQESLALPNIALHVATAKQQVTVVSALSSPVPINNGASSTTLNNRMVSQLSIEGRDAAELIKFMPGMAINSGLSNTEWNSALTQINSGPIGSFSGSGTAPYGGTQMVMNGSEILDPGNQGTQMANVNQNMTSEVSVSNAAFTAQYAHGPIIFQATGKTGTSAYHGEAYLYARNGSLNSNNSYFNASGIAKPIDHYWYPGGNIGGPIPFPFTSFNKNHDKAFFFVGYEHLDQLPVGTLHKYITPTSAMMNGDFSQSTLAPLHDLSGFAGEVPCAASNSSAWNYGNFCSGAVSSGEISNGVISQSLIDPSGLALMKMLSSGPGMQAITPTASNPYNAEYLDNEPVVSDELYVRGDANITPKIHAFANLTYQPESDLNHIGIWWWDPDSIPYDSSMPASQEARDWSVGVDNIIAPTLENEAVFGYAYFINPITLANPSAGNPATYGYKVPLPPGFSQTNAVPMIPNIVSWCCGLETGSGGNVASADLGAGFGEPGFPLQGFSGNTFGKYAQVPDVSDNLTWIKGTHTVKLGFYWESASNVQTEEDGTEGTWDFDNYASNTSFNYYADMLLGHADSYTVADTNFTDFTRYREADFYAEDSWKIHRNVTLNYGMRFEHMGQWYPYGSSAKGIMVWDPSNTANPYEPEVAPYSSATTLPLGGYVWHAIDPSIPISGYPNPSITPAPRLGAAWDMFGNGKTVLRGGFGIYRYQIAYNDVTEDDMLSAPLGVKTFTSSCTFTSLESLGTCGAAAGALRNTTSFAGLEAGDDKSPYTDTWDFLVDQAAPLHSLFEVQYQGNRTRNLLVTANGGGGQDMADINNPQVGSYFKPDPVANAVGLPNCYNGAGQEVNTNWTVDVNCSDSGDTFYWQGTPDATHITGGPQSAVDWNPYDYSSVYVFNHDSYSNYNALILQWVKQSGPVVFTVNYTWEHALGIWDGNNDNGQGSGPGLDQFCVTCAYGPLAFNRAQLLNAAYVINLPSRIHNDKFLAGVANGWQLSGDTQYQTGPPLQALTGGDLDVTYPAGISNSSVLGTNAVRLMPMLVCNPGANLGSGQYFNPNCFRSPKNSVTGGVSTVAANGPFVWPNIPGPGFFNSDLGLYKNFKITERQGLQVRFTAFNFLNHPLPQFNLTNDLDLSFSAPGGGNTNTNFTGKPAYTYGNRTIEIAVIYTF